MLQLTWTLPSSSVINTTLLSCYVSGEVLTRVRFGPDCRTTHLSLPRIAQFYCLICSCLVTTSKTNTDALKYLACLVTRYLVLESLCLILVSMICFHFSQHCYILLQLHYLFFVILKCIPACHCLCLCHIITTLVVTFISCIFTIVNY